MWLSFLGNVVSKMVLKLFNSMTRQMEVFEPLERERVKMCTCGPSIYQLPHIGNYRTFLYEDILLRYLKYLGYDVERVLNITDVEDKAIIQAEKEGVSLEKLTSRNLKIFLEELRMLRAETPTYLVRSSTSVKQAAHLIEALLKKGYAYWHRGNVYYDPLKFSGFGKLYGLDVNEWPKEKRRFHRDTYVGNRWNRGDFILWHGYEQADKIYWDTSIGKGRPAWNIQDAAMVTQHLGFEVDIYCGGIDNIFRHHDYIIAVVEAITGRQFSSYWLHGAHLYINGKKMSKSRGNIIYPRDLIERGCEWSHIRFFLIYGHYRKRLNFTFEKFKDACRRLVQFQKMVKNIQNQVDTRAKSSSRCRNLVSELKKNFEENMNNDLQVRRAFDALYETVSKLVTLKGKGKMSKEDSIEAMAKLRAIDQVLQVIFKRSTSNR